MSCWTADLHQGVGCSLKKSETKKKISQSEAVAEGLFRCGRTKAKHGSTGHGRVLQRLIHRQRSGVALERHIRAIGLLRLGRAVDDDLNVRTAILVHNRG